MWLWLWYILGQVASLLKRAHLSAKSNYTPWQSMTAYLGLHFPELFVNFLLSTGLFWTWWHDPAVVSRMVGLLGLQTDFALPLNPFLAVIYGVFSDVAMDFLVAKISAKLSSPAKGA